MFAKVIILENWIDLSRKDKVYSKESLELLRQKVDLLEVLSPYLDLKRSGAAFKALCPFHEEKTPSFIVQKGDSHYHCFGCGAHGDAIAFLMGHLKMSFQEAIEMLAEKFNVALEVENKKTTQEVPKAKLREALLQAARFYHFYLLHSYEGQQALNYLYSRGLDLEFIRMFQVGLAPKDMGLMSNVLKDLRISEELLMKTGLVTVTSYNRKKEFFSDRIVFPIKDGFGHVIGFSARKYKEETFGPKYINTQETSLFKKSEAVFGLSECRRRIAKERKAIIVEGQIDALRLIQAGFDLSVAGGGTSFTPQHAKQVIQLGVSHVYIAFDGDEAGRQAAIKVGDLFQKEGIEAFVCQFPEGEDPDKWLQEKGPKSFAKLLEASQDYLTFLVEETAKSLNLNSPSEKNQLVQSISSRIQHWDHPLMVHESLRKLARLVEVPESLLLKDSKPAKSPVTIQKVSSLSKTYIDPQRILEADFLRWLLLTHDKQKSLVSKALQLARVEHFSTQVGKTLFEVFAKRFDENKALDLFSLGIELSNPESQLFLSEILQKCVNIERAGEGLNESLKKLLEKHWFQERELIKVKIQSGKCSDEEVLDLAKKFDELKKHPPKVDLSHE